MDCREQDIRTAMVLGTQGLERIRNAHIAVFGLGGVGGALCEALARAGVGRLDLFDNDTVSLSNINRQIIALHSTVGRLKTDVMKERIAQIHPDCEVRVFPVFYLPENAHEFPLEGYDYVADAIDTVAAKIELVLRATAAGVPIIASMGTGNKLDPSRFCVTDLSKTQGCPLARTMRRELKARGIHHLKVVYSPEPATPLPADAPPEAHPAVQKNQRRAPGSLSFVPPVAGYLMAGEILLTLAGVPH